jgi:hypothetical protein
MLDIKKCRASIGLAADADVKFNSMAAELRPSRYQ